MYNVHKLINNIKRPQMNKSQSYTIFVIQIFSKKSIGAFHANIHITAALRAQTNKQYNKASNKIM